MRPFIFVLFIAHNKKIKILKRELVELDLKICLKKGKLLKNNSQTPQQWENPIKLSKKFLELLKI